MSDTRTNELIINKLSKQQYESIQNPSDTELYLVPEDEEHKPICYPTMASEVKTTSMVVKSSVSDNGKILTENGFVYNTSGNPTVSDNKVICDLGVGQFEKKLENLTINTEYHIKSYGQNSSGIVYGSELVQRTGLIPDNYQLVEYLESSGTQYINTNYVPNKLHIIETEVMFLSPSSMFGCTSTTPYYRVYFGWPINTTYLQIFYGASSSDYISIQNDNDFHIFKYTNDYVYIDDTSHQNNNNSYPNLSFILFARNTNGTIGTYSSARLAHFSVIDENNNKILNLYPVYDRDDNDKPGMYDIANGVFYTNQGTSEFIVGPDKEWDE